MTLMLGEHLLRDAISMVEAIDLLERTLAHDAAGQTSISPKFVTNFEGGAMRILFAADAASGYCAMKAYHTIRGVGTRYVVSLYRLKDGALLAVLDAQRITDLRTGAASGVVARRVPLSAPVSVGIIGSGHQACTQLESLAAIYGVTSAAVYSPTPAHRAAYAHAMSERLGIPISTAASAEEAVRGREVVAAASSSRSPDPILHGAWLDRCRLLCAVGNTRAQFAEVDVECFRDAALTIVDTPHAFEEAGELRRAMGEGALPETRRATLSQIVTGAVKLPGAGRIVFKSVGSALQDLALAARYYELLGPRAGLPAAHDVGSLKRPISAGGP